MNIIDTDSKVDMLFQLKWKSNQATHTDCYQAIQANIWREHISGCSERTTHRGPSRR